ADGFAIMLEAARLAIRHMTPVVVLADAYLAGAAETWHVPALDELPAIEVQRFTPGKNQNAFLPYQRDDRLARPWAIPGTPGRAHATGGLEKEDRTGTVGFDPHNHEAMVQMGSRKIALVTDEIPDVQVQGPPQGDMLVIGWGSTFGAITTAVGRCQGRGRS